MAKRYSEEIHNDKLLLPSVCEGAESVWHQYVIRTRERDRLIAYLSDLDIHTIIHYPIPPHLSEAYAYLGWKEGDFPITEAYANTVLSIPMYNGMTFEEQSRVIQALNDF